MKDEKLKETFENIDKIDIEKEIQRVKEEKERESIGAYFSCVNCGTVLKVPLNLTPKRCACGKPKFELLRREYYTETQYKNALDNFRNENLLDMIKDELSKNHIGDDNLKMTTFLTATSGLLKNPKRRMSQAITGDSSLGKDNCIKAILLNMPRDSFIFVTNATQSTIEDDIKDMRIIAFSEVNKNREIGANKFLVEVIKQKAEGGTSSIKKDLRNGMKTLRHEIGNQGSVLYGTTESERDEELQTRFITTSILSDIDRIKRVNQNTLINFSDKDKLLEEIKEDDSWIRIGLTYFFNKEDQYEILIPYAYLLDGKIDGKSIYDSGDARSQRDLKRLLSITCAMTYIFQEQRKVIEYKEKKILISEPIDLVNALSFSKEFFNQSYSGLDLRLNKVLDFILEYKGMWVDKKAIQNGLEIKHRNTINKYCSILADDGYIEGSKGSVLNEQATKSYDSNRIYYRSVQKAFSKPLISVHLNKLKEHFDKYWNDKNERQVNESVQKQEFNSEGEIKE